MTSHKKLTRILAIDGGGIRGIIPGQIMVALEEKLQQKTKNPQARLAEYFDFMAGTSTGGILTCIYLAPDKMNPGQPRYSARDAVDLYLKNGGQIFSVSWYQKLRSGGGITDERYSATAIEKALWEYLGDLELKQLIRPCLVTAYDVFDSRAHFFTQHNATKSEGRNYYVRDVARATSAAPTYFEATKTTSMSGVTYPLIDGGVFANNPALCAYAEARKLKFSEIKNKPTAADMLIVSLGNGGAIKMKLLYEKVKNWGMIEWIKPLINIMMSGVTQTVDYQLTQIYEAVERPDQYIRIEPDLNNAEYDMDDASQENLLALKEAGTKAAEKDEKKLDKIVDILLQNQE